MTGFLRKHLLMVLLVGVPTVAATIYYLLIASEVFVSESRFLVRSPQHKTPSGLVGQLLQSTGISHSEDDTYAVRDYILSRDALREVDRKLDLRKSFAASHIDFLDRFPGLVWWNSSFENLHEYYGKHIGVEYDPVSSITTLTARAFTAKDARDINETLLNISEQLVNTLNDRSRQDLIGFAENEVKIASDKAKDASIALLNYRSSHEVFQPDKQAALQLEGVAKIQQELITAEAELAQLKKISPENPQIAGLNSRIDSLRKAIGTEAAKVTSANGSFSARAPSFERLALDVEFADKQLGVALAELESARAEAQQKQLYLERLVQPNLPDKAMEPKRIRSIITILIISLVGFAVVSILIASIREHGE